MTEQIRIRRVDFAQPHDVDRYLHMLDAYARDPMGGGRPLSAAARTRLPLDLARHPGVYALLAENADQAVGLATCFIGYSTFQARPLLNIHDIAVLAEWRGRGVARRLIETIVRWASDQGCCRLTLEVRADNLRARHLYTESGFVPGTCSLFMERAL